MLLPDFRGSNALQLARNWIAGWAGRPAAVTAVPLATARREQLSVFVCWRGPIWYRDRVSRREPAVP